MGKKQKRKLTKAAKVAKKRRREEYMTIFINGKQKTVRRPPKIDGLSADEFIRRNADPIWLVQNEMWEELHVLELANQPEEDAVYDTIDATATVVEYCDGTAVKSPWDNDEDDHLIFTRR